MGDLMDMLEAAIGEAKDKVEVADKAIEQAEEALDKAKETAKEISESKGDEDADNTDFLREIFSKLVDDIDKHKERLHKTDKKTDKKDDPVSIVTDILTSIIENEFQDKKKKKKKKKMKMKIDLNILANLQKAEDRAKKLTGDVSVIQFEIDEMEEKNDTSDKGKKALAKKRNDLELVLKDLEEVTKQVSDLLNKITIEVDDDMSVTSEIEEEEKVDEGKNVCVCKPAICVCEEPDAYIPGLWLEQQVDPFPGPPKAPAPPCICKEDVCVCGKEDDECVCRKEDMERFSYIEDLVPKVVVCAPDTNLPRIIVCEPYTPKKLKKHLICT